MISKSTFALSLIAALAAGYIVCLWVPRPVTVVERHTEKQLQTIDNTKKLDTAELLSQLSTMVQKKNVSSVRIETQPNGTVIEERVVDLSETNSQIQTQSVTLKSIEEKLHILDEKLKVDEKITVTPPARSNYRVGALLGYDLSYLFGRHENYSIIPMHGLVGQLQFQRRLFGDVWGIAWIQTSGAGGVGLEVGF
jgi:hypothetical protein